MKERPILFGAPMVRAILDGSKTQTRRVVKLPIEPDSDFTGGWKIIHKAVTLAIGFYERTLGRTDPRDPVICPYGQPGDRLWVRETWQYYGWSDDGDPQLRFAADDATTWPRVPIEKADQVENAWVSLSDAENYAIDNHARDRRWRPSIHMPRWASRILLEIVSVRVERLNDCSEADAMAEGIDPDELAKRQDSYDIVCKGTDASGRATAQSMYRELWESINGARSWDANPWVWCVEFKKVEA